MTHPRVRELDVHIFRRTHLARCRHVTPRNHEARDNTGELRYRSGGKYELEVEEIVRRITGDVEPNQTRACIAWEGPKALPLPAPAARQRVGGHFP